VKEYNVFVNSFIGTTIQDSDKKEINNDFIFFLFYFILFLVFIFIILDLDKGVWCNIICNGHMLQSCHIYHSHRLYNYVIERRS